MTTKRLLMIAIAISITFVQEQMLLFLPNIQFTVLLVFVFVSIFTFKESLIYIIGYVLLDNLYLGGFNLFYMLPMFFAWGCIPLIYHTLLSKTRNEKKLAFVALIFGFVYGWMFIPARMIQTGIDEFWPYLIADLPFEIIMSVTGFVTVYWFYPNLLRVLESILSTQYLSAEKAYK